MKIRAYILVVILFLGFTVGKVAAEDALNIYNSPVVISGQTIQIPVFWGSDVTPDPDHYTFSIKKPDGSSIVSGSGSGVDPPFRFNIIYTAPKDYVGNLTGNVTVTWNDGRKVSKNFNIRVLERKVTISITSDVRDVVSGGTVTLLASASTNLSGERISSYSWSATHGSFDTTSESSVVWTAPTTTDALTVHITATATDTAGTRGDTTISILLNKSDSPPRPPPTTNPPPPPTTNPPTTNPPSSSSGTTSSSLSGASSPPSSPQLVKISDANQVTHPEDSVILIIESQDSYGNPIAGIELNFLIISGDRSRALLSPTRAMTDGNGRAQTTLTFSADATGEYIIDVHRSDNPDVYTEFTVTVDPLLLKVTRLEKVSGDNQTGLTGGVWAAPFVVEVLDQYDAPLAGTTVTFTVLTGGGILSAETTRTNANGLAASTLRLGTDAVTNTVEASVEGISETVTFTAEAISPTLRSISGDNQIATVGTTLANPFVVEVHDGTGNPLAGVGVSFVVRTGGGMLSHPTSITDANGQAASTLHLGTAPGTNTVEVSAEGISEIVTFEAVSTMLQFDLTLQAGPNLIHVSIGYKNGE